MRFTGEENACLTNGALSPFAAEKVAPLSRSERRLYFPTMIHVGWIKFANSFCDHHNPTDLEFESEVNRKSTRADDPTEHL
jgi:hypothetical protein